MADNSLNVARVCAQADVPPGTVRAFAVGSNTLAVYNIDGRGTTRASRRSISHWQPHSQCAFRPHPSAIGHSKHACGSGQRNGVRTNGTR